MNFKIRGGIGYSIVSSAPFFLINWGIALVRVLAACSGCDHLKYKSVWV
jgi:hypothetical protein